MTEQSAANPREPIFNVPVPIVASVAVLVLVHAVRVFLLTDEQDIDFVTNLRLHSRALWQ